MAGRVPYSQQFTPQQTPLRQLLPILRDNEGGCPKLRKAIASAFFKSKADPEKLAGNTLISLKTYGIIDRQCHLTPFGTNLVGLQGRAKDSHSLLAKHILVNMACVPVVETLREMESAGLAIELKTLPEELRRRGIEASSNSSDLSGVLNWLRESGVLKDYKLNEERYEELLGMSSAKLKSLVGLSPPQVAFLRALVALNVADWTPYNTICKYAEQLYSGEISYNWKEIVAQVLTPLAEVGLIEIRKKAKQSKDTPEGRGGKATDVKPTGKFDAEVAGPLLEGLYRAAGYGEVREIRGKPIAEIVAGIEQEKDQDKRGKALELLVIRLCQMLDLQFMGWRETDVEVTGGGEVDAMLHAARLTYSRWQVQCKVGAITLEAVAKEVGMKDVSLANVILVVGTKKATEGALTFRRKIVSTSSMNTVSYTHLTLPTICRV